MTFISKLVGASDATGPKVYPDARQDACMRALIDCGDVWSWGEGVTVLPSTPMTLSTTIGNYAEPEDGFSGQSAITNFAHPRANGLVTMAATPGRNLLMPAAFNPQPGERHLAWCIWVSLSKFHTAATSTGNIIQQRTVSGTDNIQLVPTFTLNSGSGLYEMTDLNWRGRCGVINGSPFSLQDYIGALTDGQLHQIVIDYERDADLAGNRNARNSIYIDGQLMNTRPYRSDNLDFVAEATQTFRIGCVSTLPNQFNGKFAGAWCSDLTLAGGRPLAETVALDFALNATRLRALAA